MLSLCRQKKNLVSQLPAQVFRFFERAMRRLSPRRSPGHSLWMTGTATHRRQCDGGGWAGEWLGCCYNNSTLVSFILKNELRLVG